jgi:hypothetical protein
MNPPARQAPDLANERERGKGRKTLLVKNVLKIVATKPRGANSIRKKGRGEGRTGADNSEDGVGLRNNPLLCSVANHTPTSLRDRLPEYLLVR